MKYHSRLVQGAWHGAERWRPHHSWGAEIKQVDPAARFIVTCCFFAAYMSEPRGLPMPLAYELYKLEREIFQAMGDGHDR